MEVKLNRNDGEVVVVGVSGRVDSGNAQQFEEQINGFDVGKKLVIDIEDLEYISSAGLRVFLRLRKKHADLEIINASTEVYEILDMTGFSEMLKVTRAYRRISVEGCEIIGQGANGAVYRTDPDTVVKVYLNPNSLAEIEHEREVAKKALLLGVPTAISYDVVKVGNSYASMFEMVNARSFAKILKENPEQLDECVEKSVELMKLMHNTVVPEGELPDSREKFLGRVEAIKNCFDDETFVKIKKFTDSIPKTNTMMHGDFHVKNLLMQDGEAILIDMDTLCVGHPVLEFAQMYNAYKGFGLLDSTKIDNFLGVNAATCWEFYTKIVAKYYDTTDEAVIEQKINQAKLVGLIKLLHRFTSRVNDEEMALCIKTEIISLLDKVDTID